MKKTAERMRSLLMDLLSNPGVFVLVAFTVTGMFTFGALAQYRGVIELQLLIPWGYALALLQLERRRHAPVRWDIAVLFVLFAWLLVSLMKRFGPTTNNLATWHNHLIVFFGVYALASSGERDLLSHQLDVTCALSAAVSWVFCGALLLCALLGVGSNVPIQFPFGVYMRQNLCSAAHYNTTALLSMCLTFTGLAGLCRSKGRLPRLTYLLATVMAMLVTVLTQGRTARYAMLLALAAGAYGAIAASRLHPRALVRHAAGILAGCVVLAGGYIAADGVTKAALQHYANMRIGEESARVPLVATALAEDSDAEPIQAEQTRGLGEGSFSGRTTVWKNILRLWKDNPKYLLMGYGMGRAPRDILIGSPLEDGGANLAHNTYIQFILDYGLVGFALLCAFLLMILAPVLRVFYDGSAEPGSRALCMLVVACLVLGLMESEVLGAMRPSNLMLFYALGCLVRFGRRPEESADNI